MASFSLTGVASNTITLNSGNISGISIAATSTTPSDVSVAILEGLNVNIQLIRAGRTYTIMSGNAFALGLANKIGNLEWILVNSLYKSAILRFGQTLNLTSGDTLSINVSVTTAATGQVVTVTTVEDSDIGQYIPMTWVSSVDTTRSTQEHPGGDNLTMVTIVSDVATGWDITSLSINGSGYSQQLTTPDFYAAVAEQNDTTPEYLCFAAYVGPDLDNARIITNNAAASGNTFVVVFGGVYEQKTLTVATQAINSQVEKQEAKMSAAASN